MANGRHARGAEHQAAQLDPGPLPPQGQIELADNAPTAPGRRRKAAADLVLPTSAQSEPPSEVAVGVEAPPAPAEGTGRRRRPTAEPAPPGAVPAPTGRRRRPPADAGLAPLEASLPDAAPRAGAVAAQTPNIFAAAPAVPARLPLATPTAVAAREIAPVVDLAPRAHRRAAEKGAAKAAGHAAGRRKALLPAGAPSGAALIAGAAAVAVAAIGAVGAANSGSEVGASSVEMSRASTLGLTEAPRANIVVDAASVDREQARASRERARVALADRARVAAQIKKKEAAATRAVAAAKARAARLTLLAKSYRLPVSGYHLTARFGEGGYRWSAGHTGLDFACAYGTPIHAVASGTVIFAGWDGSYGYKTVIRHADGTETWYAHQSQILIRRGAVYAGQVIGRVGATGNTSGPHLHLEVRLNDVPVDPMVWLRTKGLRP